ncbi:MAG: Hint domain-containing protein [Pseudomonadota bacterium]
MQCETLFGYAAHAIPDLDGEGRIRLRTDYSPNADRVRVHVISKSQEDRHRGGHDGVIRDLDGNILASGRLMAARDLSLRGLDGSCIDLVRIEMSGALVAVLTSAPLEPGASYARSADQAPGAGAKGKEGGAGRRPSATFLPGTRISTERGEVPVQWLRPGDRLPTRDHGMQPLIWTGRHGVWGVDILRLAPGVLSHGGPSRTLTLAGGHRVLLDGPALPVLYGIDAAFAPALALRQWPGVHAMAGMGGDGHLLRLPRHCAILAEGAWVEASHPADSVPDHIGDMLRPPTAALFVDTGFTACLPGLSLSETRIVPPRPLPSGLTGTD